MDYAQYKKSYPVIEQQRVTPMVQTRIEPTPSGALVTNNGNRSGTDDQISRSHGNAANVSSQIAGRSAEIVASQTQPAPKYQPPR